MCVDPRRSTLPSLSLLYNVNRLVSAIPATIFHMTFSSSVFKTTAHPFFFRFVINLGDGVLKYISVSHFSLSCDMVSTLCSTLCCTIDVVGIDERDELDLLPNEP